MLYDIIEFLTKLAALWMAILVGWSVDSSTIMRLTFLFFIEMSWQLLDGLPCYIEIPGI